MAPPPIQLFLTTITSQTALRQRQEYILRVLQVKKVPFTSYDLASDEEAKKLWRRKAPRDKQELPGILIGGEFSGTFGEFEEAVEFNELDQFLRLKENWKPFEDDKPTLPAQPVGVPGAYSPAQMHPHHQPSPSPSPSPMRGKPVSAKRDPKAIDAGEELGDSKLQGVDVTEDDLLALVEELGLGGDEANDLVKGLTGDSAPAKTDDAPSKKDESEPQAKAGASEAA
ncbi:hypothetical protein WOLCODRAFT_129947 [Wolfiporia cocos MD-104 SS10]|uniref:Uncharacterized protein n=1 Tax=Wolfiporia cocos (strain MD-104) TaxID=742152 RepID=A0A2H3IWE4_WOLCO|nr:hypothetical protein WOLCODRAFT_129947 [Wolfiporia cocos MD-104 SS10]